MIVDSSAILAVLLEESDADRYAQALADAPTCRMSAASFLEATLVIESRGGPEAGHELDVLIERASVELVPVTV